MNVAHCLLSVWAYLCATEAPGMPRVCVHINKLPHFHLPLPVSPHPPDCPISPGWCNRQWPAVPYNNFYSISIATRDPNIDRPMLGNRTFVTTLMWLSKREPLQKWPVIRERMNSHCRYEVTCIDRTCSISTNITITLLIINSTSA
jgi:hypothetical protein